MHFHTLTVWNQDTWVKQKGATYKLKPSPVCSKPRKTHTFPVLFCPQVQHDFNTYGGSDQEWKPDITMYCNANWASRYDRKSLSGYVYLLAGGAISWSSKSNQPLHYLQKLNMMPLQMLPNTFYGIDCYSNSIFHNLRHQFYSAMISISHHPEFYALTEHIDITHYFLSDLVELGMIKIIYIQACENLADIFMKGLMRLLHNDWNWTLTHGHLPDYLIWLH